MKHLLKQLKQLRTDLKIALADFWYSLTQVNKKEYDIETIRITSDVNLLQGFLNSDEFMNKTTAAERLQDMYLHSQINLSDNQLASVVAALAPNLTIVKTQIDARIAILKLERFAFQNQNSELMKKLFEIRMLVWTDMTETVEEVITTQKGK